ncbi:MAG: hypothetical protein V4721_12930 [Bacteroidota bacterium]
MENLSEKILSNDRTLSAGSGESMKDSMSETTANNDNALLPNAEALTNENGALEADKVKNLYRADNDNIEPSAG